MMEQIDRALEFRLEDGRTIVGRPAPEDQDKLTPIGSVARIAIAAYDDDTEGHAISSDVTVDVEGHAITLRLPNPADAATLRKMLVAGALTATVVTAGAIASLQSPPQVTTPEGAIRAPAPAARQVEDFSTRRQQAADELLSAPAPLAQPADVATEPLSRSVDAGASTGTAGAVQAQQPAAPSSGSLQDRKERAADSMLEAPEPEPIPGDISTN
jgi:hypothetical protein